MYVTIQGHLLTVVKYRKGNFNNDISMIFFVLCNPVSFEHCDLCYK